MEAYELLSANSPKELTEKVNVLINDGWEPRGSHQVTTLSTIFDNRSQRTKFDVEYTQTMILKK